jgi:hypothetical protein
MHSHHALALKRLTCSHQEAVDIEAPVPDEFARFDVVRLALKKQPRLKRLLFDEPDWNEVI